MVPGLWGDGSYVSFESVAHPGMFVCRKRDGSVHIMRGNMNDDNFRRSGSFKVSSDGRTEDRQTSQYRILLRCTYVCTFHT